MARRGRRAGGCPRGQRAVLVRDGGRARASDRPRIAASGAGAGGGLAFSLTHPTLKRLGNVGNYLTGVVCVGAYMGALLLAAPVAFGEPLAGSRSDAVVVALVYVAFGLVVGRSWFGGTVTEET